MTQRKTYVEFDAWLLEHAKNLPSGRADVLDPKPPVDDPPEPKRKPSRVRCDFCECELGADGGVLKTSEKARLLERAEREIHDLQGRLETAKQELETLKAPKPEPPEPTNGPLKDDRRPSGSAFIW